MSETTLLILILFIGLFWFIIGSRSALNLKIQASSKMHSLPFYHGLYLALISVLPAILIVSALGVIDDYIFSRMILNEIPEQISSGNRYNKLITVEQIRNVIEGTNFVEPSPWMKKAASTWSGWSKNLKQAWPLNDQYRKQTDTKSQAQLKDISSMWHCSVTRTCIFFNFCSFSS